MAVDSNTRGGHVESTGVPELAANNKPVVIVATMSSFSFRARRSSLMIEASTHRECFDLTESDAESVSVCEILSSSSSMSEDSFELHWRGGFDGNGGWVETINISDDESDGVGHLVTDDSRYGARR